MSLLRDRTFIAAALAHLMVDFTNSQRSILLAFLSVPLGLSNALIGLISTIYTLSASLSQPLFGLLADRVGPRWVATAGVLWTATSFGLAVITPGKGALVLLVLAAFGSAAFHPAGTMEATLRGRDFFSGRDATAASLFFLFGQGGLSFGPAIGGPILDRWGPPGLILFLVLALPVGINTALSMESRARPSRERDTSQSTGASSLVSASRLTLVAFVLLVALRSWAQMNMITFLPKYFSDLNYRPGAYGPLTALFMAGSALGGVAGGWLADLYGKTRVVVLSLLLAVLPLGLFARLGPTPWALLITPLAGAFTGGPHSILVVLAQRMMPGRVGVASGLVLGFTFASGALGTFLSGMQADAFGFGVVFQTTALLALIAALLGLTLNIEGGVGRPS